MFKGLRGHKDRLLKHAASCDMLDNSIKDLKDSIQIALILDASMKHFVKIPDKIDQSSPKIRMV